MCVGIQNYLYMVEKINDLKNHRSRVAGDFIFILISTGEQQGEDISARLWGDEVFALAERGFELRTAIRKHRDSLPGLF